MHREVLETKAKIKLKLLLGDNVEWSQILELTCIEERKRKFAETYESNFVELGILGDRNFVSLKCLLFIFNAVVIHYVIRLRSKKYVPEKFTALKLPDLRA